MAMSGGWVWLYAMPSDSVRMICEVTVRSQIRYHETIEPQTLRGEALEQVNAHTVADALRFMSGVQLKDYGGLGGLKTVNLRSMGSQHVGIYYDGVELGNAQNGVIDLGQLSLDNVEEVSLYQGQRSAIMQSASDFANAGSIYIRTRRTWDGGHKARLQVGSFGQVRLSGLYAKRLCKQSCLNVNVEGLSGHGHYPFSYRRRNYDGSLAYDTTATRQNGDVQALRGEANLQGQMREGFWDAKFYTYHSNRGIPGAIVNNVWRRGERQSDDNTLGQASWQRDLTDRYTLRMMAKYAHYRTHYQNRDTTQLMTDHTYRQQEAYVSLTNVVELTPWWSASASYDGRWNYMEADVARFVAPTRWSHLGAVASAMNLGQVQLQASAVYSYIIDEQQTTDTWTPALFVSYRPTAWLNLSGFAKRSFRMPTFNDLYYTEFGNALLKPEVASQYCLTAQLTPYTLHPTPSSFLLPPSSFTLPPPTFTLSVYHNTVRDKIVAYPKGQQFRWTMLNLGRVHIDGVDVTMGYGTRLTEMLNVEGRVQYTYQRARDVTDPSTSYYGHQIPYTPWHSGSATLTAHCGEWCLAYNFVYTGERYCQQENIEYNHLQPWYTSDGHLSWTHLLSGHKCKATLEVNNLLNQQYDVIINYPMPGRNFNLTLQCEF